MSLYPWEIGHRLSRDKWDNLPSSLMGPREGETNYTAVHPISSLSLAPDRKEKGGKLATLFPDSLRAGTDSKVSGGRPESPGHTPAYETLAVVLPSKPLNIYIYIYSAKNRPNLGDLVVPWSQGPDQGTPTTNESHHAGRHHR